jgi:hypothetical protein
MPAIATFCHGADRVLPRPPARPDLEPAEEQDQEQDRVRRDEREDCQADEADDPECGMQCGRHPAAVEGRHRQQVEQVEQEAGERERDQQLRVDRLASDPDGGCAETAEDRPASGHLRLGPRVLERLLRDDRGAEERNENRRADRDALALGLEDVPELVHEHQQHEADREPPAPEEGIGADRREHRRRGREDLELEEGEEQELELREQDAEQDERRRELAQDAEARLVPDWLRGLVVRVVGELRALFRGELAHRLMVASSLFHRFLPRVRRTCNGAPHAASPTATQ